MNVGLGKSGTANASILCVCVRVRVCACVRAYVRACVVKSVSIRYALRTDMHQVHKKFGYQVELAMEKEEFLKWNTIISLCTCILIYQPVTPENAF